MAQRQTLPVLPLRGTVIFPGLTAPIAAGRPGTLRAIEAALERELLAVTDNPLVFPDDGDVVAGGNFHGQPLSLPLDHLALALCELASFSERRTYALLSPSYAELPPFLSPRPGLSTGLMITQYAAAALVNECQVLAHPAGAGSIPTSAGQEDHVSMAPIAARTAISIAAAATGAANAALTTCSSIPIPPTLTSV